MKRLVTIISLALSFVMFMSCQQAPSLVVSGPRSYTFTRDGGSQSFTFTCNRDWSISTTESWISASPSSGTVSDGQTTITIKCAPNTTYDSRTATLTVRVEDLAETITVNQDTGIGLIVSPTIFDLTNAEQVIEIEVQKNVQYTVAIDDASAKWIKQGGTKALTTDKISFTIAANTSYDNREGKIVFKQLDGNLTETVTIRQSQTNGLFITTPDYNLSNEAHTLSVEVKANVEFEVTPQADWITHVETKALKASTIVLSIPANESYDKRTGTVLVKQTNGDLYGVITIVQQQTDYMSVSPTSFDVSNQEQSVEITVSQNVAYSVVIPDDARTWVAVQGEVQTKGIVDEKVILYIAKNNTYDDRETSVTIKQNDGPLAGTVKIKQAYGEGLVVEKTEYEIAQEGGTIEVPVQSNVEYEVTSNVDWIHHTATKSLSTSTVSLIIDANEKYNPREGTVSICQKDGTLATVITVKQAKMIAVESVSISDEELFLEIGETSSLTAIIYPENATLQTITWISSDNSIATIDDAGNITAVKKGKVTISAKAEDKEASCLVYVNCIPDDEIWYTTINEQPLHFETYNWGSMPEIVSNTYSDGKVRMRLKSAPTEILERAFADQYNLKTIILPETVTTLGWSSFNECNNLESISLPDNLKVIGANAFSVCENLKEITIPDNVESIAEGAFAGCMSLKRINSKFAESDGRTIIINRTLVAVAFAGLTSYTVPEGVTRIGNSVFSHFSHMGSNMLKSIILPSSLVSIGNYAFQEAPITSIKIPDSVETIEAAAFCACGDLTTVTLPAGLKVIENNVFDICHSLSSIILPEGLERINSNAFSNSALKTIIIPKKVRYIGSNAFNFCTSLESIYFKSLTPPTLDRYDGYSHPFIYTNCPINVPSSALSDYQLAEVWRDYYTSRIQAWYATPEAVDLGLSVKWASFNVGAVIPEDYGEYYAWGETKKKTSYDWNSYAFGLQDALTKYTKADGKDKLEPEDDVAHVILKGTWRMPTKAEFEELRNNCSWSWKTINGVVGELVTGSNGNTIFLPAGGSKYQTGISSDGMLGYYWTSSLYYSDTATTVGWHFYIEENDPRMIGGWRYNGLSVRAVTE